MKSPVVFSALALSLCAGSALAVVLPPELNGLSVTVLANDTKWESTLNQSWLTEVNPGAKPGTYTVKGNWTEEGQWSADFNLAIDLDPFIQARIVVTSLVAGDTAFSFFFSTPVVPVAGPSVIEGSVGGTLMASYLDNTATVSTSPGEPIYQALVDNVGVHDEFSDPYSFSTTTVDNIPATNWGPLPGPAATSSIQIINKFVLSGHDSFAMLSRFQINAIPTPGALALVGLASLTVARRRR